MPKIQSMKQREKKPSLAKALGPTLNKTLGQHFLKNPLVVDSIIEKSGIKSSDSVLEIGPGSGNLSVKILDHCRKLNAIEYDPRMAAELSKRVQGTPQASKLNITVGDFTKVDLPPFDLCISNTPYQISSVIVFKLLQHRPLFRAAILMFQREFAMRLVAKPGDPLYGRLSVNAQFYAKIRHIIKVSRNSFRPPPKVDSSVIRMEPIYPPPAIPYEEWDGLIRILFSRKHKTLAASFKPKSIVAMIESNYKVYCSKNEIMLEDFNMKTKINDILNESGYADKRAADLDIDDFLEILKHFHDNNIHFSA
eukprot:NODE_110_length_18645_cov_0.794403.p11 type:complete len:308 gc:universal NODE_110_length_18645_cov_0.794403:1384-2307(+)